MTHLWTCLGYMQALDYLSSEINGSSLRAWRRSQWSSSTVQHGCMDQYLTPNFGQQPYSVTDGIVEVLVLIYLSAPFSRKLLLKTCLSKFMRNISCTMYDLLIIDAIGMAHRIRKRWPWKFALRTWRNYEWWKCTKPGMCYNYAIGSFIWTWPICWVGSDPKHRCRAKENLGQDTSSFSSQ